MNRRLFTCAALAVIIVICAGCTRYNPDYTIWREGVIKSYDIGADKTVINIIDAYPIRVYSEYYDEEAEADVIFYGRESDDSYQTSYTVKDSGTSFTICKDKVDNYDELCDYIQTAGRRILKITVTDGNVTGISETGYLLTGGE